MADNKLQIGKIVIGSIAIGVQRWRLLVVGLTLPAIALLFFRGVITDVVENRPGLGLLLTILILMVYTIFAVATHRIFLLNSVDRRWFSFGWSRRETRFFLFGAGLFLGAIVISISLAFVPGIGGFLGLGICSYLGARLSLIFPAIAVNHSLSLRESWNLTRNHQAFIISITILVPVLFALPTWVLSHLPHTFWLSLIIDLIFGIFMIGCLSLAYLEISRVESVS